MIDELDLAFEERVEKGRHRRGARRNKKKRRGRGRTFVALFMTFALLGGLGAGAWYGFDRIQGYFVTPDYNGTGTGEAIIEVKAGQTIAEIGNTLVTADVIKSTKAFVEAAQKNSRSEGIQPGKYKVRKRMSGDAALTMLLDLKNKWVNTVTVPEGMITLSIYAKLSEVSKIPVAEFKKAAADPVKLGVPDWWFKRGDGKKAAKSLEGFLFPATYELPPDATAEGILKIMVQKFLDVTGEMNFADRVQKERSISPYEALIAASIAEAESVHPQDMAKVARVLYNRVYTNKYHCHCLEIDSAINYWLRLQGKDPKDSDVITANEINDPKNPYRTHGVDGMPIGPISNPGEVALKGAMDPPAGDWIFFMTIDKKGTMGYATDDAGYQSLKRTMCANGVLTGSNC